MCRIRGICQGTKDGQMSLGLWPLNLQTISTRVENQGFGFIADIEAAYFNEIRARCEVGSNDLVSAVGGIVGTPNDFLARRIVEKEVQIVQVGPVGRTGIIDKETNQHGTCARDCQREEVRRIFEVRS